MSLFHDEEDGDPEPIKGLPEKLPDDETIVWQGAPRPISFAIHVFHVRFIAGYFVLLTAWRLIEIQSRSGGAGEMINVATSSLLSAIIGGALLFGIAWAMARSTIYTLTDKRVVLRFGFAIRKYVNIPFSIIEAVALKKHGTKAGSLAMTVNDTARIGYLRVWPHTRPFKFGAPQPMLRAIKEPHAVAALLCKAMKTHSPATVRLTNETPSPEQAGALAPAQAAATA
ncbi:MAG: photosynthetic complex putative assembly protein PuhB [Pseudomonadota bacterium]